MLLQYVFGAMERTEGSGESEDAPRRGWRLETKIYILILVLLNVSLLRGQVAESFIFHPAAVTEGEWWRWVTHPFVHVTWYHLLLDAGAFLMLYEGLVTHSWKRRIGYVLFGVAGSLLFTWAFSPSFTLMGLCGLSGVAHGLMVVSGLEMLIQPSADTVQKRIGLGLVLVVVVKAGWEWVTGQSFMSFMHFGMMGTPLVVCHAGGVVGGLLAFGLFHLKDRGAGRKACSGAVPKSLAHSTPPRHGVLNFQSSCS